jgi:SAM-dependent methyltransferase
MNGIFQKFEEVKSRDKDWVKKFYTEWQYQLVNKKRKLTLPKESVGDYLTYNGPEDLVNWMKWISRPLPNVFGFDFIKENSEKALERDKNVLKKLGLSFDFKDYHESIGVFNAYDFIFTQSYPVPASRKIKRILDFGAGYGRQSNLWTTSDDITYVGMEGIAKSYTLQNMYYHAISDNVCDYVENPDSFDIKDGKAQIYHLPTWRHDLLPDNHFDMVMCVQVLPELEPKLVKKMINEFHRTLKTGGMLYIFDHAKKWKPGGNIDIDKYVSENGFTLEFKPHLADIRDIHGEIRIYRKTDPEIIRLNSPNLKTRYWQFYAWLDAETGGFVNRLAQIKKKYIG